LLSLKVFTFDLYRKWFFIKENKKENDLILSL